MISEDERDNSSEDEANLNATIRPRRKHTVHALLRESFEENRYNCYRSRNQTMNGQHAFIDAGPLGDQVLNPQQSPNRPPPADARIDDIGNNNGANRNNNDRGVPNRGNPEQRYQEPRPPVITYQDIKDLIPAYAGDQAKLEQYIATADTLYLQLDADHDKRLFLLAIRSKLKDRAFDALRTVQDASSWIALRHALREKIAPISPEHACTQLTNARQTESETINEYAVRIDAMLIQLNRATADPVPEVARSHIRTNNARLAKKSFEYGLINTHIRTIVISANATTLAAASQIAMELEATGRFQQRPSQRPTQPKQGGKNSAAPTCRYCKRVGHTIEECRTKKNLHPDNKSSTEPPPDSCRYCKKPGHTIDRCRAKKASDERKAGPPGDQKKTRKTQAQDAEEESDQTFTLEELNISSPKN